MVVAETSLRQRDAPREHASDREFWRLVQLGEESAACSLLTILNDTSLNFCSNQPAN